MSADSCGQERDARLSSCAMLAWSCFLLAIAARIPQAPAPADPLAPLAVRLKLRGTAGEVAKAGEPELVTRMTAVLAALGDEPKELERLGKTWEKSAAGAKPSRSTRVAAAGKLERDLAPLVETLAGQTEPRKSELARWI